MAKSPLTKAEPCVLPCDLASFIKSEGQRFFGKDSVVRNYGNDLRALRIHIETSLDDPLVRYDYLGVLATRLDHIPHVEISVRGRKVRGDAKIAYRQGRVL